MKESRDLNCFLEQYSWLFVYVIRVFSVKCICCILLIIVFSLQKLGKLQKGSYSDTQWADIPQIQNQSLATLLVLVVILSYRRVRSNMISTQTLGELSVKKPAIKGEEPSTQYSTENLILLDVRKHPHNTQVSSIALPLRADVLRLCIRVVCLRLKM